jgi:hypothetical protein
MEKNAFSHLPDEDASVPVDAFAHIPAERVGRPLTPEEAAGVTDPTPWGGLESRTPEAEGLRIAAETGARAKAEGRTQGAVHGPDYGMEYAVRSLPVVGPALQSDSPEVQAWAARHPGRATAVGIGASIAGTLPLMAAAPEYFGAAAGQSLAARMGYGALSNAGISAADAAARGHSPEDIAEAAAYSGGIGAAIPLGFATASGLGRGIRYAGRTVAEARNPTLGSDRDILEAMERAGVTPEQLQQAVVPEMSAALRRRNFTNAQIAGFVRRGLSGESADVLGQEFGLGPDTVRRYLNLYRKRNVTPMNVMDLTEETAGAGRALALTREARAAQIISRHGESAQALIDRQLEQPGRVANALSGTQYEGRLAGAQAALRARADQLYGQFYRETPLATTELTDLLEDPTFRNAAELGRRRARAAAISRNEAAIREGHTPEPVPSLDTDAQLYEPEVLDQIQRTLRLRSQSVASPDEAAHARDLRNVFLARMERHYPSFAPIRQTYAEGMAEQNALQSGAELTTRLGGNTRDALAQFRTMTSEQQELFRLGFERKVTDMVMNPKDATAAASQFSTPAFREIVNEVYPPTRAQDLIRLLNRENITTRTKNTIFGNSNTAQTQQDIDVAMQNARAAANALSGRWGAVMNDWSTWLARQIGEQKATQTIRTLTNTNPAEMLQTLDRLIAQAGTDTERQALRTIAGEARQLMFTYGATAANLANTTRDHSREYPQARKAHNGRYYLPDPKRPGYLLEVRP